MRHGEHTVNVNDRLATLTEKGKNQAQSTGHWLKNIKNYQPEEIWSSTLQRARQTAEIIAESFPGVPLQSSNLLNEVAVNRKHEIVVCECTMTVTRHVNSISRINMLQRAELRMPIKISFKQQIAILLF